MSGGNTNTSIFWVILKLAHMIKICFGFMLSFFAGRALPQRRKKINGRC
jgi:hypothetical protein